MPCRDWASNGSYSYENPDTQRKLDTATRVACELAEQLSLAVGHSNMKNPSFLSKDVRLWIKDHEAADRRRREAEESKRAADRIRKAAMSKLSATEKKVLGL